jgi:hypothetical protein
MNTTTKKPIMRTEKAVLILQMRQGENSYTEPSRNRKLM